MKSSAGCVYKNEQVCGNSPLAFALNELRDEGLILPFEGIEGGKKVPVYYLSNSASNLIEPAILLLESTPNSVKELVNKELNKISYTPEV